jgi:hypothetical protein
LRSPKYWQVDEVARQLDAIADEIDVHRLALHPVYLPPELIRAARRIVATADRGRTHVVVDRTPTSQAVLQVIDTSEIVTAAIVRQRLASAGHVASLSTITVSLHRACGNGDLIRTARGRFRLPTAAERKTISGLRDPRA